MLTKKDRDVFKKELKEEFKQIFVTKDEFHSVTDLLASSILDVKEELREFKRDYYQNEDASAKMMQDMLLELRSVTSLYRTHDGRIERLEKHTDLSHA